MSSFLIFLWLLAFFGFFLRLLLSLIHFTYSGYEFLDIKWLLFKRKLKNFLHLSICDSREFVSDFVKKLEKRPSHFLVIVGEDGINLKDFSNLVIWCLAAKIPFLSFYDYSGYLKKNKYSYYQYLIEKRKIDPNCIIFDLGKQNGQNGVVSKINLNVFSLQDGKPLFVEVTKKLSQNVISNKLEISDIKEKIITTKLYEEIGLPEPDLGVICGKTFTTFGFLPWHTRVTEFLHMKSINGISVTEFTSVLMTYSSCIQRFGK